jgi:hypothetical protein
VCCEMLACDDDEISFVVVITAETSTRRFVARGVLEQNGYTSYAHCPSGYFAAGVQPCLVEAGQEFDQASKPQKFIRQCGQRYAINFIVATKSAMHRTAFYKPRMAANSFTALSRL